MPRDKTPRRQFIAQGGYLIVEFSARYKGLRQHDDSTALSVYQRTTGGPASFLLEREMIRPLADWFASPTGEFSLEDTRFYLKLARNGREGVRIDLGWKSASGTKRAASLSGEDTRAVAAWLDEIDRLGWLGWKSGVHLEGAPGTEVS